MKALSCRRGLLLISPLIIATSTVMPRAATQDAAEPRPVRFQASAPLSGAQLMNPAELVAIIQAAKGEKPLILNVGPRLLYMQAHIPGAEYIGQGSEPQGLQALKNRVKALAKNRFIVLYCGCCPWSHCPNIEPAYQVLKKLGFTKVKALYMADNLGTDWVYKGYPTVRGQ